MLRVRECLLPLLDSLGDGPDLLLEPTAGQEMLCTTVGDLEPYLEAVDWHPRAGVCLDTCHVFAAGHDLAARGGVAMLLAALAPIVERGPARGASRLRLIHANDSKDGCGSHRDRHENIGGRPDRDRALRGPPASSGHQGGAVHRRDSRAPRGRGGRHSHPEGAARERPGCARPGRGDALGCSRARAVLVLVWLPARYPDGRPPDPALTRNDLTRTPGRRPGVLFVGRNLAMGDRRTRWSW